MELTKSFNAKIIFSLTVIFFKMSSHFFQMFLQKGEVRITDVQCTTPDFFVTISDCICIYIHI